MKKVEATIHQCTLVEVKNALQAIGVEGMTTAVVRRVDGEARAMTYRGVNRTVDAISCVRVETVVPDDKVETVIDAILRHAHTGTADDGTIIVAEVGRVVRIRTGEIEAAKAKFAGNSPTAMVVPSKPSRWSVPSYQHSW
jgi:nitrogen regulatory protein P-II 1